MAAVIRIRAGSLMAGPQGTAPQGRTRAPRHSRGPAIKDPARIRITAATRGTPVPRSGRPALRSGVDAAFMSSERTVARLELIIAGSAYPRAATTDTSAFS